MNSFKVIKSYLLKLIIVIIATSAFHTNFQVFANGTHLEASALERRMLEKVGPKDVIIVIGYQDSHAEQSLRGLFEHEYNYGISQLILNEVTDALQLNEFFEIETPAKMDRLEAGLGAIKSFVNTRKKRRVTVINPNLKCSQEPLVSSYRRTRLCPDQVAAIEQSLQYMKVNLKKYSDLVYIGHSRKGLGLGLGPFHESYTMPLVFFNSTESGYLKRIFHFGCDSTQLYKDQTERSDLVNFFGFNKKTTWINYASDFPHQDSNVESVKEEFISLLVQLLR